MRSWTRWLFLIEGLAAAFVAVASIVQAARQGSWAPIATTGWIPAVVVATWPATYRRCRPCGRGRAGWAAPRR